MTKVLVVAPREVQTLENGKPALWPESLHKLWLAKTADWSEADRARVYYINHYTPRPYVDDYNRGSRYEGFTYILSPAAVCYLEWIP